MVCLTASRQAGLRTLQSDHSTNGIGYRSSKWAEKRSDAKNPGNPQARRKSGAGENFPILNTLQALNTREEVEEALEQLREALMERIDAGVKVILE